LIDQSHSKLLSTEPLDLEIEEIHFGLYGHDSPIPMQNLVMKVNMMIAGAKEQRI